MPIDISKLSSRHLLEIDACTRCGECLNSCPVYAEREDEGLNPRGKIQNLKRFIRGQYGLWARIFGPKKLNEEDLIALSEKIFRCTLCGACDVACPVVINPKDLSIAIREIMVEMGHYPKAAENLKKNLLSDHNISADDNEDRAEWVEDLGEIPEHGFQKDRAEVVYFVGCVSSFFPMVQKIPQNFVQIMDKGGVDFTILGEGEWCCGFPLIGAGMSRELEKLKVHNLDEIKEVGAKSVVFSCPSCYRTWKELYDTNVELLHSSHLLERLIKEKKIPLKELNLTVTYHDPCDLGRNSGVYEPPREVLRMIPGVKLVELENNREKTVCCGGGGNVEMVDPELSAGIAQKKIDEIQNTGANIIVTSCQQCVRTISTRARKQGIKLKVMDLTEIVMMAMK
jgi:heterodisulfide reductase subunit D